MHIDDQNFLQLTSKALQHSQATVIMPIYRKCWPHLQHFKRSEVRDILQYVHGPLDPGLTAGSHITTAAINERNGKKTGTGKKKKKRDRNKCLTALEPSNVECQATRVTSTADTLDTQAKGLPGITGPLVPEINTQKIGFKQGTCKSAIWNRPTRSLCCPWSKVLYYGLFHIVLAISTVQMHMHTK